VAETRDYDHGRTVEGYLGMPQKTPVSEELRADNGGDLIDVKTWNPAAAAETPHARTEEEPELWAQGTLEESYRRLSGADY
jgi:hypothetical protein